MIENASSKILTPAMRDHYPILDALRFFLASWVVMGHFGVFPLFAGMDTTTRLGRIFVHGWNSIVVGVPAVIGFFVISGFCIHLPYRGHRSLPIGRYYARRYIRILVPVFAGVLIWKLAGNQQPVVGEKSILWQSVLWSLACEEIYYAVYPLLRWVRKAIGWAILIPCSFGAAAVTAASHPSALDWSAFNPLTTALILFPVWLLGCVLAERVDDLAALDSKLTIWQWRLLAWAGSWVCEMLHFHAGVHMPQTMLWFGVIAYFWIKREIAYSINHRPLQILISAGAWSYSLYLMHFPAQLILSRLSMPSLGYVADWLLLYGFVLSVAYVFYRSIEKPSHALARRAGSSKRQSAVSTVSFRPVSTAAVD